MSAARPVHARRARGASMLEFVVAGIVVAMLAGVLLQRLHQYRQQAEHASAQRVVALLRTALAARATALGTRGRVHELHRLVRDNPMSWLERPPPNYMGELDGPDVQGRPGQWYFDRKRHLLVYLLNFSTKFPSGISAARYYQVKLIGGNKHVGGPMAAPAQGGIVLVQVEG